MAKQGGHIVLATPSGSKPAWLSKKYPEVCRVERNGLRMAHGGRHNHCYSSPVFRRKVSEMSERLARRYKDHPALIMWHINNEFNGGECHCNFCYARYRSWLKQRYGSLKALNHAWWNHFWAHAYSSWDEIEAKDSENTPGELDWRRFISDNCIDYFKHEIAPLKRLTPKVPVTANFMGAYYGGLDYWKLAAAEDVVSWDSYPQWHRGDDVWEASTVAFSHDVMRSMKHGKPFILMESTPEGTNWQAVGKGKAPGMHLASSLQAVAHGSDSVMYFQWRKGRGSCEQFHGAVVDHAGHENTRLFKEVAATGALLEKLSPLIGTSPDAEVAMMWDQDTRWAVELARGPRNRDKDFERDAQEHYFELWKRGIPVDGVNLDSDISKYKVLIATSLFMLTEDFARKIEAFVRKGGVLVTTYLAGTINESMLCHLGGRPGLLRKVLGIWAEETDALADTERQTVVGKGGPGFGLKGSFPARHYADIVHLEGAEALATYGHSWYAKSPALTENSYGRGKAYYLAARGSRDLLDQFYGRLAKRAGLRTVLDAKIPKGVEVCERADESRRFVFLINFNAKACSVPLGRFKGVDMDSGKRAGKRVRLGAYGVAVLRQL
jgi:beta-galactosidase